MMKTWKLFAAMCCTTMALLTTGCSSDSDSNGGLITPTPNLPTLAPGMQTAALHGEVRDVNGQPLQGVTVKSGTSSTTTDKAGAFILTQVSTSQSRSVVTFSKSGYFNVVRSVEYQVADSWSVVMTEKGNTANSSTATYAATEAKTMTVNNMKVELPAGGYVVDATGAAYTGTVTTDMVYLDPNDANFSEMMPGGDLAAVRTDGTDAQLISYGMTCVNMTDNAGNKLQLKDGSKAKLQFPIPAGMEALPTIPLWSFDETTGLWVEEGVATLVNDHYEGEVSHFSWVNLDSPSIRATLNIKVVDASSVPVPGMLVKVGQLSRITNANGAISTYVASDEAFKVSVDLALYGGEGVKEVAVSALNAGDTKSITLSLPQIPHVKGTIKNSAGGSNLASLTIKYTEGGIQKVTKANSNNMDGTFDIIAPINYRGTATLHVASVEGKEIDKTINLTGQNINVGDIELNFKSEEARFNIVVDGQALSFPISIDPNSGMTHIVNRYSFHAENENSNFIFEVYGYGTEEQSVRVHYVMFGEDSQIMIIGEGGQGGGNGGEQTVNIVRQGDFYDVTITGRCQYMKEGADWYSAEGVMQTTLKIPVYIEGEVKRNTTPQACGLPSYTPSLNVAAPFILCLKEKNTDIGGVVYYNGGRDEYATLKAQADNSGLPYQAEPSFDTDSRAEIIYRNDVESLTISYNSYAQEMTDETPWDYVYPQIKVTALKGSGASNMNIDFVRAMKFADELFGENE